MAEPILARLLRDHEDIRRLALCVADVASHGDAATLEETRWALARVALPHLGLDDRHVLTPLEKHGGPEGEVAKRFRRELESFNEDFLGHMKDWTGSAVQGDRDRYVKSVRSLVARLHERLAQEERDLYPLISRLSKSEASELGRNWAADAWAIKDSISR